MNRTTYLCPTCNYAIPEASELVTKLADCQIANRALQASVSELRTQLATTSKGSMSVEKLQAELAESKRALAEAKGQFELMRNDANRYRKAAESTYKFQIEQRDKLRIATEAMELTQARADDYADSYISQPIRQALAKLNSRTSEVTDTSIRCQGCKGIMTSVLCSDCGESEKKAGAVKCDHEAYQGSCVHCGVAIHAGKVVSEKDDAPPMGSRDSIYENPDY